MIRQYSDTVCFTISVILDISFIKKWLNILQCDFFTHFVFNFSAAILQSFFPGVFCYHTLLPSSNHILFLFPLFSLQRSLPSAIITWCQTMRASSVKSSLLDWDDNQNLKWLCTLVRMCSTHNFGSSLSPFILGGRYHFQVVEFLK